MHSAVVLSADLEHSKYDTHVAQNGMDTSSRMGWILVAEQESHIASNMGRSRCGGLQRSRSIQCATRCILTPTSSVPSAEHRAEATLDLTPLI